MGHLLGYARVSTTDQHPDLQVDALTQAGCYRVFTDRASGARADRPQFAAVLDQLRPGDTLVVGSSTGLAAPCATWSTPSPAWLPRGRVLQPARAGRHHHPGGKLVFHVFAALAEFERDLVGERTTAGLVAARARGRTGGRPTVMTPAKLAIARQLYASGEQTVAAIAATLGVSRASIYRHLGPAGAEHGTDGPGGQDT
jgi:DNA invertase Pin-like site-specific DNA recombinase